jgi:hypothetical protein
MWETNGGDARQKETRTALPARVTAWAVVELTP